MYAIRYSENIKRDFRRGHSYAGWGATPYATKAECEDEWRHHNCRYSRELGGWLPVLPGLCAAGTGDTPEEAFAESEHRCLSGMEDLVPCWVFPCRLVDVDEYGWDVVVPTGRAKKYDQKEL